MSWMATCISCFRQVPDDVAHCVHCGASLTQTRPLGHRPTVEGPGPVARPNTDRGVPAVARISPDSLPPHLSDAKTPEIEPEGADPPSPEQPPPEQPEAAAAVADAPASEPRAEKAAAAQPSAPPGKPVLASESLAAEAHPVEPGRRLLRLAMGSAGLWLLVLSILTWAPDLGQIERLQRIFCAMGGVLLLGGALLRLPYVVSAALACGLGLGGVVLAIVAWPWADGVTAAAIFVLATGLFLRWRFRGSRLARTLVAVGAIALLATLFFPRGGEVPLAGLLAQLAVARGSELVIAALPLLLLLLSLLSLLALLGADTSGFASVWACALICYLPLKISLGGGAWIQGTGPLAFFAVGCLGAAQLLGSLRSMRADREKR